VPNSAGALIPRFLSNPSPSGVMTGAVKWRLDSDRFLTDGQPFPSADKAYITLGHRLEAYATLGRSLQVR
jgi:hypothetical protein